MLNVPEHNLREFLGREKVPYMDHYRQSVDLGKFFFSYLKGIFTRNSGIVLSTRNLSENSNIFIEKSL